MSPALRSRCPIVATFVAMVTTGLGAGDQAAQSTPQPALPTVNEAVVPQYSPAAVAAGASGVVHVSVTTDGHQVTAARVLTSQPVLDEIATRSVRTWKFVAHTPTQFDVTFRFQILARACDSLGRDTHAKAVMHFPTEIDVFAERDADCPGATPLPPEFGIYVREAWIPPLPTDAGAAGFEGTVRIGVSAKGELSVAEGPPEIGNPLVVMVRRWSLVPPPFADEMRFSYMAIDPDCHTAGGPIVTAGPSFTTYTVAARCR